MSLRNVQDRIVEIGVLMSLGYASSQILRLFLIRSFSLAVSGGFAGFLCGGVLGTPDYHLLGPALLLSSGITAISTSWPAIHASRQDPADIMRYD